MDEYSLLAVAIIGFVMVTLAEIIVHKEDGFILSTALAGIMSILGFLAGKRRRENDCEDNK